MATAKTPCPRCSSLSCRAPGSKSCKDRAARACAAEYAAKQAADEATRRAGAEERLAELLRTRTVVVEPTAEVRASQIAFEEASSNAAIEQAAAFRVAGYAQAETATECVAAERATDKAHEEM